MMKLFKERQVHKTYLALVYGNFDPSTGDVRLPLARHPLDRRRFTVTPLGKESLTEFKRLGKYGHMGDAYSLMELRPVTGRTHQLRVHMSWLGFPIVGDPLYAGPRLLAKSSKVCQRLFLHARHINFIHPYSGENVSVSAELDETLEQAMECLCIN
ncbi:MAG: hypothetical protein CUN55_18205 [Phototrophicales bacterium]|nr:MAG: hypothetical protein CUN55_18205 [Phototrophicales bacterium]